MAHAFGIHTRTIAPSLSDAAMSRSPTSQMTTGCTSHRPTAVVRRNGSAVSPPRPLGPERERAVGDEAERQARRGREEVREQQR